MPDLDSAKPLVAAVLTEHQQETVDFFRALNVPASWFVGTPMPNGAVEVIAIGDDRDDTGSFVWAIVIEPEGDHSQMEATVSPFMTGISV